MDVKHLPLQLTLHLLRLWIQLTDFILLLIGVQLFYSVVLVCTANWLSYTYTCVLAAQSCLSLCNSMTIALQAPLSMQFSRQEYWNGLPFPTLGDFPDPGMEPALLHCMQTLCHLSHQGSPYIYIIFFFRFFSHIGYYRILSRVSCGLW